MGRDGSSGGGAGTKVVKPSSCMVKRSEMGDLGSRLARAPGAVAGRLVARSLVPHAPSRPEPPGAP
eukprot:scaffold133138_cov51-Phaeocystis_antarctica.AAC.2